MFIYNVTVNIDDQVHDEWLNWMRDIHMPAVMRSGCFVDSQLLKVLYVDDNGHTYSAQYRFLEMQVWLEEERSLDSLSLTKRFHRQCCELQTGGLSSEALQLALALEPWHWDPS